MASLLTRLKQSLPDVDGAILRHLAGDQIDTAHAQGRTLEKHLRGTQRTLAAWSLSTTLQRAGMCHSLYSTDSFPQASVPLENRDRVQKAIGRQAEELVFLFCAIERGPFFRNLVRAASLQTSESIPIEVRQGFEAAGTSVTGIQARDLLLLHLANAAEQSGNHTGALVPWLEKFQRMMRMLADKDPGAVPTVFQDWTPITRYSERQALALYLQAIRLGHDPAVATPLMEEVSSLLPFVADPHVWLAWWSGQVGDEAERRHHARFATDKLLTLGFAWDKRLLYEDWLELAWAASKGKLAADMFEPLRMLIDVEAKVQRNVLTAPDGFTEEGRSGLSRFENYLMGIATAKNRRVAAFYPDLRADRFWPSDQFKLAFVLENQFTTIQREIEALEPGQFQEEAERIRRTGNWQVFMLLEAGRWNEEHLSRLPVLSRILRAAPELRLAGGLAYLSRLAPGTVVAPHTGPTNMRLRLHLGLTVPDGDCAMRVDGVERHWVQGRCTIFNDFLEHEVWNRTSQERLILLVDVWHPDLTVNERKLLEAVHWMAQQHGEGLMSYWRKNEAATAKIPTAAEIDDLVL